MMGKRKALSLSMFMWNERANIPHVIKGDVVMKQETIEDTYGRAFGEALEVYNKDKIASRKIESYYEHVKKNQNIVTQRELLVEIGDVHSKKAKEMLSEWYGGFEERNPNLIVSMAVIHTGESVPVMVVSFIPVADGYKRGLTKQISLDRALDQQGVRAYSGRVFVDWRQGEIDELLRVIESHGFKRGNESRGKSELMRGGMGRSIGMGRFNR